MIIPPPSFSFKGDKNKAMLLRSQALQLYDFTVRAARLGGLNSVARTFTLSDGSTISFHSAKQSNYNNQIGRVVIFSPITLSVPIETTSEIYMESGLVIYTATGCGALNNSYRPWRFRVLDSSGPQGTFTPSDFSFSGVLQGLESIAFGCKIEDQVDSISATPCGEGAEPITISEGGYCTTSLLPKKNNYLKVRPSVFSGLTRRYVQALYGSNKYDLEVDPKFFSIPHVKVPRYVSAETLKRWDEEEALATAQGVIYNRPSDKAVIYADFPACQFISKTSDYYYFFVDIRDNQFLDIYPMVFGESGGVILDKLRAGGFTEVPEHLESYALSDSKPDTDTLLGTLSLGSGLIGGEPLAFTWNSNSKGNKLTIVTHSQDAIGKMYSCREYSITLQITRSDTPSTLEYDGIFFTAGVSLTQISPDAKWNPRLDTVWGHNYTSGMQMWFSGSWPINGTTLSDPLTPLYSYYDYNDTKRVITLESSLSNPSASSGLVIGAYGCGPGVEITERDSYSQGGGVTGTKKIKGLSGSVNASRSYSKSTIKTGDPYIAGIAVGPGGGITSSGGCTAYSGDSWSLYTVPDPMFCQQAVDPMRVSAGVPSNFCTPISTDATGGYFNAGVLWDSIAIKTSSTVTGEVKGAKAVVVIPFDDCCSVLYGINSATSYASRTDTTLGGWACAMVGYVQVHVITYPTYSYTVIGDPVPTLFCSWRTATMAGANYGYFPDSQGNSLGLNSSTTYPANYVERRYDLRAEVQGIDFLVKSGTDLPLWLDSLLNPVVSDLFHLMQPTSNCTSDLHGNYSISVVTDSVLTYRQGFKEEEIGAMGWQ